MKAPDITPLCACLVVWLTYVSACSDGGDGAAARADGGSDAGSSADGSDGATTDDSGTATNPCPSGVLGGDSVVETDEDVAAIASCTEITGDLTITSGVETVDLPSLLTVGGSFRILETTALPTLELPSLVTVTRDLEVNANAALARFAAPVLESATVIGFVENAALEEIDVGALVDTGFVRVQRNDALRELDVPRVEELGVFFVSENASIVSVSFDSLTTITIDGFILSLNPVLTTVSLPVLTHVFGDVLVSMNPMFPTCRAEEIMAKFDDPTVPFVIIGNDDSATCP